VCVASASAGNVSGVIRWRPSHTLTDRPSGSTSQSRTNTSAYPVLVRSWMVADTGPITSSGSRSMVLV
jgi:hypothetical protein